MLNLCCFFYYQLTVRAGVRVIGNYFNENVSEWEPLIEPVQDEKQGYRHWELNLEVRQAFAAIGKGTTMNNPHFKVTPLANSSQAAK